MTAPLFWIDSETGVSVNGSNQLTSWTNQGSGGSFTSVTGTPTRVTSVFPAGQPGVLFGASGQYATASSGFANPNPVYSFSVFKRNAVTTAGGLWSSGWLVGTQTPTAGVVVYGTTNWSGGGVSVGDVLAFNAGNGTIGVDGPASSTDTTSAHMLSVLLGSAVTPAIRADGSAVTTTTTNSLTTNSGQAPGMMIGAGSAVEGLNGYIGALIILGYSPTADEYQRLEGWAAWKYGMTANLPSGHPYKSSKPLQCNLRTTVIAQNTRGAPGYASRGAGVPSGYDWQPGAFIWDTAPPSNCGATPTPCTAATLWMQVYPTSASVTAGTYSSSCSIQIKNFRNWMLQGATPVTGVWTEYQSQNTGYTFGGAIYLQDVSADTGPATFTNIGGGVIQIPCPASNRMVHWWLDGRATFTASTVIGTYAQADIRVVGTGGPVVAMIATDWWLDGSAGYVNPPGTNNPASGVSNWIDLDSNWKTVGFISQPPCDMLMNPPPPLNF